MPTNIQTISDSFIEASSQLWVGENTMNQLIDALAHIAWSSHVLLDLSYTTHPILGRYASERLFYHCQPLGCGPTDLLHMHGWRAPQPLVHGGRGVHAEGGERALELHARAARQHVSELHEPHGERLLEGAGFVALWGGWVLGINRY